MQDTVVSVENLTVKYKLPRQHFLQPAPLMTAVDGVSFTVQAGASLGIVGESGSGKSSTARAIMAIEKPTSGVVRLFGHDVSTLSGSQLKALRPRFQMVFQDPYGSLDPRYSVARILAEPLHGVSSKEVLDRSMRVLSEVGLKPDDLRKYPNQFSGGQRQRIAIARALITRPSLIVADEAVSALDVSVQAQVLNLMKDVQAEHNIAYVFITHDLAVVEYLCEEIVVLYKGRIVESGRTRDVLANPAHPYTRNLIEAMPQLGGERHRKSSKVYPIIPVSTSHAAGT